MTTAAASVIEEFNRDLIERGEIRWDLIDPEIVVVDHDIPDAGDYRGHRGFEKWLVEDWGSAWESYTIEPEKIVDVGADVVVLVFTIIARGKGSGIETRRRNATVNKIRDGRFLRVDYYTTEEEAWDAAGVADKGER